MKQYGDVLRKGGGEKADFVEFRGDEGSAADWDKTLEPLKVADNVVDVAYVRLEHWTPSKHCHRARACV